MSAVPNPSLCSFTLRKHHTVLVGPDFRNDKHLLFAHGKTSKAADVLHLQSRDIPPFMYDLLKHPNVILARVMVGGTWIFPNCL